MARTVKGRIERYGRAVEVEVFDKEKGRLSVASSLK